MHSSGAHMNCRRAKQSGPLWMGTAIQLSAQQLISPRAAERYRGVSVKVNLYAEFAIVLLHSHNGGHIHSMWSLARFRMTDAPFWLWFKWQDPLKSWPRQWICVYRKHVTSDCGYVIGRESRRFRLRVHLSSHWNERINTTFISVRVNADWANNSHNQIICMVSHFRKCKRKGTKLQATTLKKTA